ncbi:MAG: protein TolQ [Legionellaceae bacterium]|nr:protein TolQ [Legionellaceae bacterium]
MEHTSILGYFIGAGGVVKVVMFILLMASVVSWTLILQRAWYFRQKSADYDGFKARFWGCSDLKALYTEVDTNVEHRTGLAAIFHAGFKEFLRGQTIGAVALEPIQRGMQICHAKEEEALEAHLPWFASVGSIAPYIGLFGTVWGIMTSFQALGNAQQATIAMVAPGISEALVATALGLFTAIPAVIAFNRYGTRASKMLDRYDVFQEELLALIEQQTSKHVG